MWCVCLCVPVCVHLCVYVCVSEVCVCWGSLCPVSLHQCQPASVTVTIYVSVQYSDTHVYVSFSGLVNLSGTFSLHITLGQVCLCI